MGLALVDLELVGGNRIAVRIERRIAEPGGDQALELLGENVLEHLGLGVNAIPGHSELLREEQLEQPVVAQYLERDLAAAAGEPYAVVGLMLDESQFSELAQHRRNRARRDAESLGEVVGRNRTPASRLQGVDPLA